MMSASAQSDNVPVEKGPFEATWESIRQWECPEWFQNAKFGMWAHWGPQCEAEDGDWYARFMYYPNTQQWNWHTSHFGSPETTGLKDLIHAWKAENWQPDSLVKLYKEAGAQYFMTLGNHHDNFDLWNSPYQEWNSVNMGPQKDIVKGWSEACKKYGLPLGVSIHASHAWTWLEPSQPYDGNLTKEDGADTWWEGYDPQELYAQRHAHSTGWENSGTIHSQWAWGNGASKPTEAYMMKLQNRVLQLIRDYDPSMLYFDDTVFPFYGITDNIGLNILSDFYNHSANKHGGKQQVVVMGKILDADQKEALLWDVERGIPDRIQNKYWQTCTCIGDWHYSQSVYNNNGYKSAGQVIRMLVDIVSKNGNMLLSIPVRGDGSIDDKELVVVKGIGQWMKFNKQSIYGTHPWKTFGEGPLAEASNPLNAQGFNEGNNYSDQDVRYTERNDTLYATIMAWPEAGEYRLKSLGVVSSYYNGEVEKVELLGHGEVTFAQKSDGLYINVPISRCNDIAPVFQITFGEALTAWQRLQQLVETIEEMMDDLRDNAGSNTGKLNRQYVTLLESEIKEAKSCTETSGDNAINRAIEALTNAYEKVNSKTYPGGVADAASSEDITVATFKEMSGFARKDATTTRFATPKYWTVENFEIPQTDGSGTKNGIDNYPGTDCLMLGIWNDRGYATGSLADARIYQKVHLEKGRYYFGGAFDTHYNLSNGYIFASTELAPTKELEEKSMAFYPVSSVNDGNTPYGIYFTVEKDTDVYLGFQTDLSTGAATQEMRVKAVRLLKYNDVTTEEYNQLVESINAFLRELIISKNTGYYSAQAVDDLNMQMAYASELASDDEITDVYLFLKMVYSEFLANGKNAGGTGEDENSTELTIDKLIERSDFTPVGNGTTRFEAPKYWTVENFNIPQNDNSGTKAGLDNFTGTYSLMMGLWNDRAQNTQGNLANARIYRSISLPKGTYYFGATFDDTWLPVKGYIYASGRNIATSDMETQSVAYYDMAACTKDGTFNGIYFALDEDATINVGFQCDFTQGSEQQEFRAKKVKLLRLDDTSTDIPHAVVADISADGNIYNLSGQHVGKTISRLPKGIYISKGKKLIVK